MSKVAIGHWRKPAMRYKDTTKRNGLLQLNLNPKIRQLQNRRATQEGALRNLVMLYSTQMNGNSKN